MFLSSTVSVVEFTVVVDPLTVRSADTVNEPSMLTPPEPFAESTKSSLDLIVVISFSSNLTPDVLICPVVVKFSLPNEIAPVESVIDPVPNAKVLAVIVELPLIAPVTSKGTVGEAVAIPTLWFDVSTWIKFASPVDLIVKSDVTLFRVLFNI
jgi:hypothetical protein